MKQGTTWQATDHHPHQKSRWSSKIMALFAPKVRQNEKTLLLKEFFLFAPKQNEQANQVIKRFYDRVHDIRVAGIEIPADQQMVILLLEALSHDP